jgi:hypothetical protein
MADLRFKSYLLIALPTIAACSTDTIAELSNVEVTLNVSMIDNLPSNRALTDKIYPGKAGVDLLVVQAYESDGDPVFDSPQAVKLDDGAATMTLSLSSEERYTFVAWAQNSTCKAYDLQKFPVVRAHYPNTQKNNDTTLIAYCGKTAYVDPYETPSVDLRLRRAVAQLNVGMSMTDYLNSSVAMRTNRSRTAFVNLPTSLNLLDGTVTQADTTISFAYSASYMQPNDTENRRPLVTSTDVDATQYAWLSMTYILAPDEQLQLPHANFRLKTPSDDDVTVVPLLPQINFYALPIKQAQRTNIITTWGAKS